MKSSRNQTIFVKVVFSLPFQDLTLGDPGNCVRITIIQRAPTGLTCKMLTNHM